MRMAILFLLLFALSTGSLLAQDDETSQDEVFPDSEHKLADEDESTHELVPPEQVESTRSYRTETVTQKRFDEEKWKEVVGGVDFREAQKDKEKDDADEEKEEGSGISQLDLPWGGPLLRLISYAVIIGVAILLVYFIIRNISFDLHIRRTRIEENPDEPVERIEELDIDALLDKASREGDFKLAIRLCYLRLLKKLNEQGVISWKKDKTNRDYLTELFSRNFFYDEIRRLTSLYESVWYGEHTLNADAFESMAIRFQNIHQKINAGESQ